MTANGKTRNRSIGRLFQERTNHIPAIGREEMSNPTTRKQPARPPKSTDETKAARASKVAGLKLARVVENTDQLPKKAPVLPKVYQRSGLAKGRHSGRQNQNPLPRWLAASADDVNFRDVTGSDHEARCRNVKFTGASSEWQLSV
jgi:hypothetical protein